MLVATINFIYTELFYAKWKELHRTNDLHTRLTELEQVVDAKTIELIAEQDRLVKTNADIERLANYVAELEAFKKKELDSRKCPFCKTILPSLYHLASHRANCEMNPKKSGKDSVFESVV